MKITLIYKYIFHDIKQLTVRYAEARFNDGANDVKDIAQINDIDTDNELVVRFCHTGVAKLNRILKDYVTKSTIDSDDELKENEKYIFNFIETNVDGQALASLMHWFVVKFCLYEWSLAFSPADSASIQQELDDITYDLDEMVLSAWPVKSRRTIDEEVSEIEIVYPDEA